MISLLISMLLALFVLPVGVTAESSSGSGSRTLELPSSPEELESFLKNAATAMESYAVINGTYEGATLELLEREGLRKVPGIRFEIASASDLSYCLEASAIEGESEAPFNYDSTVGHVEPGSCSP